MYETSTHKRELNNQLASEPRLAKPQRDALRRIGELDQDAECVGLNERLWPVVETHNLRQEKVRYALDRSGAPRRSPIKIVEQW